MCVCTQHPHVCVCVHSIHIPRQDGNRLYQPADRHKHGGISIKLIERAMEAMTKTELFITLPGGRLWLFDHLGAQPGEDGKVDKGVVHHAAVRRRLSHESHE